MPNDTTLIARCSHCKQIFSTIKFDSHDCELPITGVKEIPVIYFREDFNGKNKTLIGRGIDGMLYAFVVEPRKPLPYVSSIRRKVTPFKSDEEVTEP